MSDSVRPHGLQPTRLLRPWDSPGKNTGVGCHFLLQCRKVKSESEVTQSCLTFSDPMDCSLTTLLHPWDFPGKSTGVGCHFLLQTGNRNIHIDNYLKHKRTKCSNQKTQSGCTGTKTGPVYILPTRDSLQIYRHILKVMGCKQVFHENGNQHKVDVEIII